MKYLARLAIGLMLSVAAVQSNATIILMTGDGGSAKQTLSGLTLGNGITFQYMFADVVYVSGPWIGINASVINPLIGPFPAGQFNDWKPADTGWLNASIDTSASFGNVHDLAFTANTFNTPGNSATVKVRGVSIDGNPLAVSEPGAITLLMLGLAGLVLAGRRKGR